MTNYYYILKFPKVMLLPIVLQDTTKGMLYIYTHFCTKYFAFYIVINYSRVQEIYNKDF